MKWIAVVIAGLFAIAILALIWMIPVRESEATDDYTPSMIPSELKARTVDAGSAVQLNWSLIEADGVKVIVQRSASGDDGTWTDLQELPAGVTSYRDSDLGDSGRHVYRLYTFDGRGGEGISWTVSVDRDAD